MFQVLLVTRGGARGKLFLWTAALQNLVFSRGFHSSSNFERCSQERFAFQKGLEGVAFAVTMLMADTRNPESFATSEPSKEIEDEDEDDCGCGYAALYSCVRFGVNCRLILQKEHNDGNRGGNLPAAD
jgi:hypothetical protein